MSYELYKVLHLVGVIATFLALGGLAAAAATNGGERIRRLAGMMHGFALLVIFVSGFGLLAKLKLGLPAWSLVKIVLWLALGGVIVAMRKLPQLATLWWIILPLAGALAAFLGVYKPF